MRVEGFTDASRGVWDAYVAANPKATFFHRAGWMDVIARSTGHTPSYHAAYDGDRVAGVLPLFLLSTGIFGRMAVSMPFLNIGGVAADTAEAETALIGAATASATAFGCEYIEFRQRHALAGELPISDRKVTSEISLDGGSEAVFARLHQNVRNKVRKAGKEGVAVASGHEHLDEFYSVYARNVRDLGTPVLPRRFFEEIVRVFPGETRVYRATREGRTVGVKMFFIDPPAAWFVWAATPREHHRFAPVQALNWRAIEEACGAGCAFVDFGRSTAESSHQNFKKILGCDRASAAVGV
ncbi:MAG: GNAT family N-acetyltransferase [Deltaproteobacteria bacterium]|nr:GNAT family N-acetyltransferase [Deltaproteobacteria bacterium]